MTKGITPPVIEERILAASKIMGNMLVEALIQAGARDISTLNFRILDMVNQGIDKPTEIAKMFSIVLPTLSSAMERLEKRGLLLRNFSETDRRRVVLDLTKEGKGLVQQVNQYRMQYIGRVLKNMDSKTKEQLQSSLSAFIGACSANQAPI